MLYIGIKSALLVQTVLKAISHILIDEYVCRTHVGLIPTGSSVFTFFVCPTGITHRPCSSMFVVVVVVVDVVVVVIIIIIINDIIISTYFIIIIAIGIIIIIYYYKIDIG